MLFALVGLVLVPALSTFFGVLGLGLPVLVPTFGSIALASVFFFLPNYNAADDAKRNTLR